MMKTFSRAVVFGAALLFVSASAFVGARASAANLVEVTSFGQNPSNLRMYLYVPDTVVPFAPVLVAVHYCTGSGPVFFSGTEFRTLADQYGFIVIYPSATRSGSCFDVSTAPALTHNGGSDPVGIVSMVNHVLQNFDTDADRVFVTGASSGAMMTNVLLGDYPDVFAGGAAFMGVPFGCFATTDGSMWNSACANGNISHTAVEWGNIARAAFPGYSGPRPKMQLWHGTNDNTLFFANFGEEIKQWTDVLGVSQTAALTDHPQSTWTRTRYGATGIGAPVEAISIQGAGHSLPSAGMAALAIQFFGLDTPNTTPDTTPPSTPANLTAPSRTASSVSLSWGASTDDRAVTGYDVLRANGATGGSFVQVGTNSGTSFVDSGLNAGSTYRYQVRARDAAGNLSAMSNTVTVTTQTSVGGGCTAVQTVQSQWSTGYVLQPVTITNNGTSTINSWTVTFTLPAGHAITGSWNATFTVSGQTVTARNMNYNGTLAANAHTDFGFQASRPSGNTQLPSAFQCTSP